MEIETLMMPFVRAETERRLNDRLLGCKEKVMDVTGGCNGEYPKVCVNLQTDVR